MNNYILSADSIHIIWQAITQMVLLKATNATILRVKHSLHPFVKSTPCLMLALFKISITDILWSSFMAGT